MTRRLKETGWVVRGLNLISSDSIYQKLVHAIKENNLSEKHLQDITGHRAPIQVNTKEQTIVFCPW